MHRSEDSHYLQDSIVKVRRKENVVVFGRAPKVGTTHKALYIEHDNPLKQARRNVFETFTKTLLRKWRKKVTLFQK